MEDEIFIIPIMEIIRELDHLIASTWNPDYGIPDVFVEAFEEK